MKSTVFASSVLILAFAGIVARVGGNKEDRPRPGGANATAAAKIGAEIARIDRGRDMLGDNGAFIAEARLRAKRALDASRVYLALDEMQEPFTFEAGWRYAGTHRTIKTDEQFSREWQRVGAAKGPSTASSRGPAVVSAIAAANAVRAPATWRASLPYSQDAGLEAGLYYLGESQAFAAFPGTASLYRSSRPLRRHRNSSRSPTRSPGSTTAPMRRRVPVSSASTSR